MDDKYFNRDINVEMAEDGKIKMDNDKLRLTESIETDVTLSDLNERIRSTEFEIDGMLQQLDLLKSNYLLASANLSKLKKIRKKVEEQYLSELEQEEASAMDKFSEAFNLMTDGGDK